MIQAISRCKNANITVVLIVLNPRDDGEILVEPCVLPPAAGNWALPSIDLDVTAATKNANAPAYAALRKISAQNLLHLPIKSVHRIGLYNAREHAGEHAASCAYLAICHHDSAALMAQHNTAQATWRPLTHILLGEIPLVPNHNRLLQHALMRLNLLASLRNEFSFAMSPRLSALMPKLDIRGWPDTQQVFKKPVTVSVHFASADGICQTLEGPVQYQAHDAIVTAASGESWPIGRPVFEENYEQLESAGQSDNEADKYRKKYKPVHAVAINEPFTVPLQGGANWLQGKAGDWLMQYAPQDFGIVAPNIFHETYERISAQHNPTRIP
jgi:hypothetical protein